MTGPIKSQAHSACALFISTRRRRRSRDWKVSRNRSLSWKVSTCAALNSVHWPPHDKLKCDSLRLIPIFSLHERASLTLVNILPIQFHSRPPFLAFFWQKFLSIRFHLKKLMDATKGHERGKIRLIYFSRHCTLNAWLILSQSISWILIAFHREIVNLTYFCVCFQIWKSSGACRVLRRKQRNRHVGCQEHWLTISRWQPQVLVGADLPRWSQNQHSGSRGWSPRLPVLWWVQWLHQIILFERRILEFRPDRKEARGRYLGIRRSNSFTCIKNKTINSLNASIFLAELSILDQVSVQLNRQKLIVHIICFMCL